MKTPSFIGLSATALLWGFYISPTFAHTSPIANQTYNPTQFTRQALTKADPFTHPHQVETDLARIDSSLNATKSFFGKFIQYGPDGSQTNGTIHIRRPGRLRIEYAAPNPLLIVSDGVTLTQLDRSLETQDRVPLGTTPLSFFLKNDVNLAQDTEIIALQKDANNIRVTAQDGRKSVEGQITFVFDRQTLALQEWVIADDFGGETRVLLSDLQYNQNIDPRLFILRDDRRRNSRR